MGLIRQKNSYFFFLRVLLIVVIYLFSGNSLSAQIPNPDLVMIESRDAKGTFITRGIGVIQKNGYVICNYHIVAGGRKISITKPGNSQVYISDGYMNVLEIKDLVILSVPGLEGNLATFFKGFEIPVNAQITFAQIAPGNTIALRKAIVKGPKEINEMTLLEAVSKESEDCISGPVFYNGDLAGFVTAGYYDGSQYIYVSSIRSILSMLGSSFIIKTFDSFDDEFPIYKSKFQTSVLDMIHHVIWLSFEDAVRLAKKNDKKILVDICAKWNGWCNMLNDQVYSQKGIIKYINENYYAVKLDAESKDSIWYQGRLFTWSPQDRCHQLAYSLLEGKMNYPATAFLNEEINLLTVVPGFMDVQKMKVALHFFIEEAYRKPGMTFEIYQSQFREEDH